MIRALIIIMLNCKHSKTAVFENIIMLFIQHANISCLQCKIKILQHGKIYDFFERFYNLPDMSD